MNTYEKCELCFRKCGVDRTRGEKGYCGASDQTVVYTYSPHLGEEPPLSGTRGSGTIFFSHCCMGCLYCQNWQFSHTGAGKIVNSRRLGEIMLELVAEGCHNINLVNPTHYVPSIIEALNYASGKGLDLPIVYNTGGYDSLNTIRSLKGKIDIFLPDIRYSSDVIAEKYSFSPGYVANNRDIVKEMYDQVGLLKVTDGIVAEGLIIRLLIMPKNISGTIETLDFIAKELGKDVYLSVMAQYYPAHKALSHKDLSRRINRSEYQKVVDKIQELDLNNG